MALVTLGEASRLVGVGKTTLSRAIKAGRLSASRTDTGSYEIDPAELHRVYPFKPPTNTTGETVAATGGPEHHATPNATLEVQIAGLKEVEPSATREFFIEKSASTFSDIGGHVDLKRLLDSVVEHSHMHNEIYDQVGLAPPSRRLGHRREPRACERPARYHPSPVRPGSQARRL
jgi:excisionase family DNA binding protein